MNEKTNKDFSEKLTFWGVIGLLITFIVLVILTK
jgi:hypothetical protein